MLALIVALFVGVQEAPVAEELAWDPAYHDEAWVVAWVTGRGRQGEPENPRAFALTESPGGRTVHGLEFGADGPLPLAERATVVLVGALDGRSLSGAEAVMSATDELLAARTELPEDLAFVVVPWAAPDGLARALAGGAPDGQNDRPFDDDRDGLLDEDAADDLDGDGMILEMLVPDPSGAWARAEDDRFLRPARPDDSERYELRREGRDDDGDGSFNEDGPGGVRPDRNFPLGWEPFDPEGAPAVLPLEAPESRALADLLLARRPEMVLFFQGAHGGVAVPDEAHDPLRDEAVTRLFATATGRKIDEPRRLAREEGGAVGSAPRWVAAALGIPAYEIAAWGPTVDSPGERVPGPGAETSEAWVRWLDDVHGGLGFGEWHPVEPRSDAADEPVGVAQVLVGGWEPFTRDNPPVESLPTAIGGMATFVRSLAESLPRLALEIDVRRDGPVVFLDVRAYNRGVLPLRKPAPGESPGILELRLPPEVRLVAGAPSLALGELAGGVDGVRTRWILAAPEGAVFEVTARAPGTAADREVKP